MRRLIGIEFGKKRFKPNELAFIFKNIEVMNGKCCKKTKEEDQQAQVQ